MENEGDGGIGKMEDVFGHGIEGEADAVEF
jgi:hypothetical protein